MPCMCPHFERECEQLAVLLFGTQLSGANATDICKLVAEVIGCFYCNLDVVMRILDTQRWAQVSAAF